MTGPVKVSMWEIRKKLYSAGINVKFDSNVDVDGLSGATRYSEQ